MPTVYSRLQEYKKNGGEAEFSKRKYKQLVNCVRYLYDRKPTNPILEYTSSLEGNEVFTVRNYPESFVRIIDAIIRRFERDIISIKNTTPVFFLPTKKERKRIPWRKPVYTGKKLVKHW